MLFPTKNLTIITQLIGIWERFTHSFKSSPWRLKSPPQKFPLSSLVWNLIRETDYFPLNGHLKSSLFLEFATEHMIPWEVINERTMMLSQALKHQGFSWNELIAEIPWNLLSSRFLPASVTRGRWWLPEASPFPLNPIFTVLKITKLIHSLIKCLLSLLCIWSTMLHANDLGVNKSSSLFLLVSSRGESDKKAGLFNRL